MHCRLQISLFTRVLLLYHYKSRIHAHSCLAAVLLSLFMYELLTLLIVIACVSCFFSPSYCFMCFFFLFFALVTVFFIFFSLLSHTIMPKQTHVHAQKNVICDKVRNWRLFFPFIKRVSFFSSSYKA